MTEEEAISKAQEYVRQNGLRVKEVESIRKLGAEQLRHAQPGAHDTWVIHFTKTLRPGIVVACPDTISIWVDDETGEASQMAGL